MRLGSASFRCAGSSTARAGAGAKRVQRSITWPSDPPHPVSRAATAAASSEGTRITQTTASPRSYPRSRQVRTGYTGQVRVSSGSVRVGFAVLVLLACGEDGSRAGPESAPPDDMPARDDRDSAPAAPIEDASGPASTGESPALFAADHVLEVEIELAPEDWDVLRYEGRTLSQIFSGCGEAYEYTRFVASVSVDGERAEQVAI